MSKDDDYIAGQLCVGYVEGIADFLSQTDICIPHEVEAKQLKQLFVQYASKHQALLHGPASELVAAALRESYSCRKATAQK